MLEVQDLHKSFGALEVIKGVTLSASKGDIISILGRSGSGKSTFLRCVNFLEMPSMGKVILLNQEVAVKQNRRGEAVVSDRKQMLRLRTRMAMVFQQFNLWSHMTVLENVSIALTTVLRLGKSEARTRAEAYLARVNMSHRRNFYPGQLSGGQQQRAAIARALAMEPDILLFDEPTSALDPELVEEVLSVIRALAAEGRTMLVVTHELKFACEVSSRVVFFDEGVIVEDGSPIEVFEHSRSEQFRRFIAKDVMRF